MEAVTAAAAAASGETAAVAEMILIRIAWSAPTLFLRPLRGAAAVTAATKKRLLMLSVVMMHFPVRGAIPTPFMLPKRNPSPILPTEATAVANSERQETGAIHQRKLPQPGMPSGGKIHALQQHAGPSYHRPSPPNTRQ